MNTYAEFQSKEASEKVGLVALDAGKQLMGWSSYSGSVYELPFSEAALVALSENGTALSAAASIGATTAGKYYYDRSDSTLYLQTTDSSNPNSKFIAATVRMFFANIPVRAAWDLATGYDVAWLPILKTTSQFGVGLDNTNLLGFAIEGSGTITLHNDKSFWASRYDKYFFEGQQCYVYSWNRQLPVAQARLIYKGRVETKSYSSNTVSFSLKDQLSSLRSKPTLSLMSEVAGALMPGSLNNAFQRLLFGYVKGYRPTNIDQILDLTGYTLTGTVTVTNNSTTITGSGTSFLSQLSPGDEVIFGSDTVTYTINTISSNTSMTITEAYEEATAAGRALRLKSTESPKRYMNRVFHIAGHELREPSTTVTKVYSLTTFEVANATDFVAGEPLVINNENLEVLRVSGNKVTLVLAAANVSVGDTVKIPSVRNVYLNNRALTNITDYTYNADTAQLTLNTLAEFNVAPVRSLTGTLAFTATSRAVTGTSTFFKKELKSGDWVRRSTESDWFEILSVDSDTQITLRTASTYTSSGASFNKSPEVYSEGQTILSCDVLGVTENGTKEGVFVNNAPRIVKYLLGLVGLSSFIDEDSFDDVDSVRTPFLGFSVPERYNDTSAPSIRDIINTVNQSVFGTLYQTTNFQLAYSILSPRRPTSMQVFAESDLLDWDIKSDSANLTKTVKVEYLAKEFDVASGRDSKQVATATSTQVENLTDIEREKVFKTYLIASDDATRYAKRWAFILGASNSTLSFRLALQGASVNVNDPLHIQHEFLCQRFGSTLPRRIGGVASVKRDISRTLLEVDDVGGSFARCATITEDDAAEWDAAEESERMVNGYITDDYGMIDNDPDTFGINLIW